MRGKDWIFVSDAHFTGRDPGEMESFIRFLDSEDGGWTTWLSWVTSSNSSSVSKELRGGTFPYGDYLPVLDTTPGIISPGCSDHLF